MENKLKAFILSILLLSISDITKAQTVPPYVPTANLEAWYSFDSSAADSSGRGNNGIVYGATLVADRFGHPNSAYQFNGVNNYIIIPPDTSLNINADITISAWVKSAFAPGLQTQIYFRGDTRSAYDPYMLYVAGSSVIFLRNVGSGLTFNQVSFPVSIIDTSRFHLVVGTFSTSDDSMRIYYDGQLQQAAYFPAAISYFTDTAHNTIGACDYGTWQVFNGTIDDVGTWRRGLSVCEITKLYYAIPSLITSNPSNVTLVSGGTATFSITDTGGAATYQWQENSGSGYMNLPGTGIYTGVYSKTLTIHPVSTTMCTNQYRCIRYGTCVDTSSAGILLCPTGTSNIHGSGNFDNVTIFPNPGNGTFTVNGSFASDNNENIAVEIYNLLGQKVYAKNIVASHNMVNEQLLLNGLLAKGTYMLQLHSESDNKTYVITIN